jgi:hypothetical protein
MTDLPEGLPAEHSLQQSALFPVIASKDHALHFPTLLVLTQITWTFCVPLCFLLRFNSHCPILFTGNIFHYWFGLRVCNLFSNRPLSDCMASYCVILGALQAILQRNHGAVIERRQSVQE